MTDDAQKAAKFPFVNEGDKAANDCEEAKRSKEAKAMAFRSMYSGGLSFATLSKVKPTVPVSAYTANFDMAKVEAAVLADLTPLEISNAELEAALAPIGPKASSLGAVDLLSVNGNRPFTLGELIELLENCPRYAYVYIDEVAAGRVPREVYSYRGYYNHLAIGYGTGPTPTVEAVLLMLRGAVGGAYEGYKGGWYHMGKDTPVWASASHGAAEGYAVNRSMSYSSGIVIIGTKYMEGN